ncbi:methyltransferase [Aureococcus anophagefferens]|nr:methyltransferase [Aureococcus anophagefferens]
MAAIVSVAAALPATCVTNDDLAQTLDTSDAWIASRTGIRQRFVLGADESFLELCVDAAARAAGGAGGGVDFVVVATTTPASDFGDAAAVGARSRRASRRRAAAASACAAPAAASSTRWASRALVGGGAATRCVVVAGDALSGRCDARPVDGGALRRRRGRRRRRGVADGRLPRDVCRHGRERRARARGRRTPAHGRQGRLRARDAAPAAVRAALDDAGWDVAGVARFVFHQANARILEEVAAALGLRRDQCPCHGAVRAALARACRVEGALPPLAALAPDSLACAEFAATLEEALGRTVPTTLLLDHATLPGLVAAVEGLAAPEVAAPQKTFAATAAQHGMLFHHLSDPGGRHFVEVFRFDVAETVRVDDWRRAWREVVARRDALRSTFDFGGDAAPTMTVHDAVDADAVFLEDDTEEALAAAGAAGVAAALDGGRAPLVRAGLAGGRCVVAIHHLVTDGASTKLLLEDVAAAYAGAPPPKAAVGWVAGAAPPRRRRAKPRRKTTTLPVAGAVDAAASTLGVPPAALVHASFAIALGGDDVAYGATVACRDFGRHCVGPALVSLPTRLDVRGTMGDVARASMENLAALRRVAAKAAASTLCRPLDVLFDYQGGEDTWTSAGGLLSGGALEDRAGVDVSLRCLRSGGAYVLTVVSEGAAAPGPLLGAFARVLEAVAASAARTRPSLVRARGAAAARDDDDDDDDDDEEDEEDAAAIYWEWDFPGGLDVDAFASAWDALVARHGTLRAHVGADGAMRSWRDAATFAGRVAVRVGAARGAFREDFRGAGDAIGSVHEWPLFAVGASFDGGRATAHVAMSLFLMDAVSDLTFRAELSGAYEYVDGVRRAWADCRAACRARGVTAPVALLATYCLALCRHVEDASANGRRFLLNVLLCLRYDVDEDAFRCLGNCSSTVLVDVDLRKARTFGEACGALRASLAESLEHSAMSGVEVMALLNRERASTFEAAAPFVFTTPVGVEKSLPRAEDAARDWCFEETFFSERVPHTACVNAVKDAPGAPAGDEPALFCSLDVALCGDWDADVWAAANAALSGAYPVAAPPYAATPEPPAGTLLQDALERRVGDTEQTALFCVEDDEARPLRRFSFAEVLSRSRACASLLRGLGLAPGFLGAVVMAKGWRQVVAVHAILFEAGAYVPCDAALWPAGGVRAVVSRSAAVCLVDGAAPADLGGAPAVTGVVCHHRGALNTIEDLRARWGLGDRDVLLGLASLAFDLSVFDVFGGALCGAALALPRAADLSPPDPDAWLRLCDRAGVTVWNSVPALLDLAVSGLELRDGTLPRALRVAFLSGDVVPAGLPARAYDRSPTVRVVLMGGATEAAIWSNEFPVERPGRLPAGWGGWPYGRPMSNQTMSILSDATLEPLPPYVVGVIHIGGVGVMTGYRGDDEKNRRSLRTRARDGRRFFRTGDLGRMRLCGGDWVLEILGREDGQAKVRGFRVELGEIEAAISSHPKVRAAACAVVDGGGAIEAHVVLRTAGALDAKLEAALRATLAKSLPTSPSPALASRAPAVAQRQGRPVAAPAPAPPRGVAAADEAAAPPEPPATALERGRRVRRRLGVSAAICAATGHFFRVLGARRSRR